MGRRQQSFRSKAAHFVSDLTTVFLNPISDRASKPPATPPEDGTEPNKSEVGSITDVDSEDLVDGPDTSSFSAFLYSLLTSPESEINSVAHAQNGNQAESSGDASNNAMKQNNVRKGLLAKGKQSLSKAIYQVTGVGGNKNQGLGSKGDSSAKLNGEDNKFGGIEMRSLQNRKEAKLQVDIHDTSDPSVLLSEKIRSTLYASLPALVQGRKWVLLYSTWRNGISLSTLYRKSTLWPGLSLLVVGDRKGAVFGGLIEAPLKPTNKRKYQGTNSTFVFTNTSGCPIIFRPTGANRYFTLCSNDFLALGGGGHFALYLDADLLSGSSSVSETYGNSCLAHSEDFEVKEVELWGFVYSTKYEEVVALCHTEAPGICRW